MNGIFLKILDMTAMASCCILVVMVLRLFLKKLPKIFSYLLWLIVLVRLLCPFAIESSFFGLLPAAGMQTELYEEPGGQQSNTYDSKKSDYAVVSPDDRESMKDVDGVRREELKAEAEDLHERAGSMRAGSRELLISVCAAIWLAGVCGLLLCSSVSVWKLKKALRVSRKLEEGIYESEEIENPFLFGIWQPRIYLPCRLEETEKSYIIAHEMVHKKRRDYLIKPLFYAAVCLHWFNPLVWAAWVFMCKDMEMSCDEAVLGQLGENTRREYSTVLLKMAAGKHAFANVPLAFGENDTKARIKNILSYKKPVIWAFTAALLLTGMAAVFLLTNRKPSETQPADVTDVQMTVSMTAESPAGESKAAAEAASQSVSEQVQAENQRLRGLKRNEQMTFEKLKELVMLEPYPLLEDYAGYEGAVWPSQEERTEGVLGEDLQYVILDEETGEEYWLRIDYGIAANEINYIYLYRTGDRDMLFLYDEDRQLERITAEKIDAFRFNLPQISDWLSWRISKSEYIKEEGYKADIGEYGGEIFTWTGESSYTTNGSESAPESWRSAGGIMRNSREFFTFEDGVLTDMYYNYNHSVVTQEAERLEGCEEQAVIRQMSHDLFTAPELYMAEEAGKAIPENEQTVNMWYVGMAREDAEYGYVFFLNGRYFDKEDVIEFARSVRFTDRAWVTVRKEETETDSYNRQARELDRSEEMTFEKLEELIGLENPTLMDYAGYDGARWSERTGDLAGIREDLTYYIPDKDEYVVYRLYITYYIENNQLEMVSLTRQNDGSFIVLYDAEGIYPVETDIRSFRHDRETMSDWLSYTVPKAECIEESKYLSGGGYGYGGVSFEWTGEGRYTEDKVSLNADWQAAGGIMRYPVTSIYVDGVQYYESFVFEEGKLTDFAMGLNHTSKVGDTQQLEGCAEQAVLVKMNHDLFTVSDIADAEAAGKPIPEDEQTSNIWYVAFAREDAPYGYIVYLNERYYNREDVIEFAQSVRFTEEAWK